MREVVTFQRQQRIPQYCHRISRAIRQVEPRLWVDALAVATEGIRGRADLCLIEGDDLDLADGQKAPDSIDCREAMADT